MKAGAASSRAILFFDHARQRPGQLFRLRCSQEVHEVSEGLVYRDFITVGLLLKTLEINDGTDSRGLVKDNWIYIQEPDVAAGRLQIFNNWSPFLVRDPGTVWIGVEYFCNEGDDLWRLSDEEMAALARQELEKIGIIRQSEVLDSTVIRMAKDLSGLLRQL